MPRAEKILIHDRPLLALPPMSISIPTGEVISTLVEISIPFRKLMARVGNIFIHDRSLLALPPY